MFTRFTVGLVVLVWIVVGAAPALADEFTVGVVLESPVSDPTFMDGFRLAVDQSPDVSHPAGVEGGDHLGSMDVAIVIIDSARGRDEIIAATRDLVSGDGAAIIVADVSSATSAAVAASPTGQDALVIIVGDSGVTDLAPTQGIFVVGPEQMEAVLADQVPPLRDAFVARYGSTPSPAATRGFVAGRLVDIAVEATNRDPSDIETLTAALVTATTSRGSPTTTVAEDQEQASTATVDEPGYSLPVPAGLIAVVVVVLAIVAILHFRDAHRADRDTSDDDPQREDRTDGGSDRA